MKLKITISLILLTLFCGVSVFSQDKEKSENKEAKVCECDYQLFNDEVILNLDVKNKNLRDILSDISTETGATFVVDQEVKDLPTTIYVKKVHWRIVLDSILRSQELALIVECPIIRIVNRENAKRQENCPFSTEQEDKRPLFTDFIKLENVSSSLKKNNSNAQENRSKQRVGMSKIVVILEKRLTKRGTVEVACKSNFLIITDVRENIKPLMKLVKYLDKPEMYKLTEEEYKKDNYCKSEVNSK